YFMNNYDKPVKMISTLAPYMEVDKEELPDYKI
ncbi:MAG: cupin domain-containing protein, partial [Clostridia bacterium]|nr:cupin domain-containing protein [Clostridia bacterium]